MGLTDVCADDPWFGLANLGGPLTAGTTDRLGLFGESKSLARQGKLKQLLRESLADSGNGVFELSEGRAPGRATRAVETVSQIFGDALEVKTDISDRIGVGMRAGHPWSSQRVRARVVSG